jgi:FkbM family methyltransferase
MIAPVEIVQARYGRFMILSTDGYVSRSLKTYGEFSEAEIALWRLYVKPGDLVIDAGANIGAHTVALARLVGETGAVIAFEPIRFLAQLCAGNVALNGLTNVFVYQMAVGAQGDLLRVPVLDYTAADNFGGVPLGQWTQGERVTVTPLDDVDVPRCAFLKIDVEGMEEQVIRGAAKLIAKHRPVLYIELSERNAPSLLRTLQALGYRAYLHEPPLFNPENYHACTDDIYAGMFEGQIHNVLCVPRSAAAPGDLPELRIDALELVGPSMAPPHAGAAGCADSSAAGI